MENDWYRGFFKGLMVEMWQNAVSPEWTRSEVDFLEVELRLRPGQRVLDVPCGFGRHALEMAKRGYVVTGVDVSEEMIAAGRAKAAGENLHVDWRLAEMRELPGNVEFDAAYCFGNSFGYLDRAGMRSFLAAITRALKPGARFAFDYGLAAECILPRFKDREWSPVNDLYFLEENRYHLAEGSVETIYTTIRDGKSETRTGWHWVYTASEVQAMLREAGLEPRAMYGSCARQPFTLGSMVLIMAAEKV
jgi:SAM-dependent methyltransferase